MHANGGATDARGTAVRPIYGPSLDGTLPGNEVIELSRNASRVTYARAMGPMQFLPGTWSRYASDGNGDGKADVQNVFDSTLAAARYLCSGGLNLRDQSQVMTAILRYNNSMAYAQNVLGWAAAYATGVVPVDLPPITGPIPPIADVHLDNYQGLGPGLPLNALGLPANDPLALVPLVHGPHRRRQPDPPPRPRLRPRPDARAAARPARDDASPDQRQYRRRGRRRGCSHRRSRTARCSAWHEPAWRRCSRSCRLGPPPLPGVSLHRLPGRPCSRRTAAADRRRRHRCPPGGTAGPAEPLGPPPGAGAARARCLTEPADRAASPDRRRPTLGGDVQNSH